MDNRKRRKKKWQLITLFPSLEIHSVYHAKITEKIEFDKNKKEFYIGNLEQRDFFKNSYVKNIAYLSLHIKIKYRMGPEQ